MSKQRSPHLSRPLSESLREYGRGVAGGLLFSLPLLYTMEVWWRGFLAEPTHLLAYVGLTFLLLLGYNRYSGMHHDARLYEVAVDSIEEMGLGILISAGILYLLGRISAETPWQEIVGKVVVEAMTVAIGVSVGTAQLGNAMGEGKGDAEDSHSTSQRSGPWAQAVLGFCGAVLVASNVAPTEEIVVIGIEASPQRLLGVVALSLAVSAMVLYFTDFTRAKHFVRRDVPTAVAVGTINNYGLALVASALMLWFFGRFQGVSLPVAVSQTVVLALPAALGASAGRLLIQ